MSDTDGTAVNGATTSQCQLAVSFRAMHHDGPVLQLVNAWNGWSARIMAAAGARAIGTTSFGVSLAHGVFDGEQLPFDRVVDVAAEIAAAVVVPVTVDLEAGRGATPADVGRSVATVVRAGAVGINIEDSVPGRPGELFAIDDQCERLAAARRAADELDVPIFLNARCDLWFGASVDPGARVDEALARAGAYRAAGADGLFLPGLLDLEVIATVTGAIDLPLNVMAGIGAPGLSDLSDAGVRRISQGGGAFIAVSGALKAITERYLGGEVASSPEAFGAGASLLPALVA